MTSTQQLTRDTVSPALRSAMDQFTAGHGFLAVASIGIATTETVEAQKRDIDLWASAQRDPQDYDAGIERTRGYYAKLVGVTPEHVATGAQTSVMTSVVAAAVPAG